jgi:hypothetical protein
MKQACLAVLLLLAVVASAAAASSSPSLRLVDRAPVTVRGSGFAAGERVTVVLSSVTRVSRAVHAGAGGGFVVRFPRSLGRCARYSLQAYGATGTRARLTARLSLDCMPNG